MGKIYLLVCNRVGPELFSLLCHTELIFILDATEFLRSVHVGPLLRSFVGLSHCSKTSHYSLKSAWIFCNLGLNGHTMLLFL